MTLRYGGPNNGYIPEATGQVVAFIRQPDKFKYTKYAQLIPVDTPVFEYTILGRDESVRVRTDEEFAWAPGADMPSGDAYKSRFTTAEGSCSRRAFPWRVDKVTDETATLWKPKITQMAESISMAMTHWTWQLVTVMENTANWGAYTAPANTLNGGKGKWGSASDDPNSPNFNAIAATFLAVAQNINLYTNSVVQVSDIQCVISPGLAISMSQSAEIKNYVRQTELARTIQTGTPEINSLWGLPSHYQGIAIHVEDAARVSSRALASGVEATTTRTYIKSDTSAVFCSRPGGLDGALGEKSFSTLQVFHYKEQMRVKAEYDSWNEVEKGACVTYFVPKIAAAPAGYLVTGVK